MDWEIVEGYQNLHHKLVKSKPWYKKILNKILSHKFKMYFNYLKDRKFRLRALRERKSEIQLQKATKIAIIFIGTNKFINFFPRYFSSINQFFLPNTPKDFFVFTNEIKSSCLKKKKGVFPVFIPHENTSFATLMRFKQINSISKKLAKYSHIIYIDSDMYANTIISEKQFFLHDKPLFGVQHPVYARTRGPFETNPKSLASVKKEDDLRRYRQGCFWGGKAKDVLKLSKKLEKRINIDLKNKIIACWLDESHLNKYFIENENLVHTYPPSYAYPQEIPIPKPYKKKFIHGKGRIVL